MNIKFDFECFRKVRENVVNRVTANKWYQRIAAFCEFVKDCHDDYPKLTKTVISTVIVLFLALYFAGSHIYHRFPAAYKCWYEASFIDEMPSERWQFNWIPSKWEKQCQRRRANGDWIAYSKAVDAGMAAEEAAEEVEELEE